MTQQHPITPPSEVIGEWWNAWVTLDKSERPRLEDFIAVKAAQYGADQELEACCVWMADETPTNYINALRAARRPKPPSLKEQALEELDRIPTHDSEGRSLGIDVSILRRALEQLPNSIVVLSSQC